MAPSTTVSPFPMDQSLRRPVCVFCGASPGNSPMYIKAAESLGQALARNNIPLVYGGGRRGIMGVVSQATLDAGGYAHGVLPRALLERASEHTPGPSSLPTSSSTTATRPITQSSEGVGNDLLENDYEGRLTMELVNGMHERKAKMAELSTGGFVVLPGGYGTFEEVLEMITWNQLGIHSLPIIILNIGNFYTSLLALFQNAVDAGFIKSENLSLMRVVDLPGGKEDNVNLEKAGEWGQSALKALQEWTVEDGAGYGFKWNGKDELDSRARRRQLQQLSTDSESETTTSTWTASKKSNPIALFTTLRCTSPDSPRRIETGDMALLERHIRRIREAHSYFSSKDGHDVWGEWVGEETIRTQLCQALEERDRIERGDWRVRIVYHPLGKVDIQIFPAPPGGFNYLPTPVRSETRRPLVLDPKDTVIDEDSSVDYRLYKTFNREMYESASRRAEEAYPSIPHPEVVIHTRTRLLETSTSNIAIQFPAATPSSHATWITPSLSSETPLLSGVMRGHLIDSGVISEGVLSVDDFERARRDKWRVIGFNGLRGVWEAELM